MSQYATIMEMLDRYNRGEMKLSDEEADLLAMQSKRVGENFRVENRPLAKGAFDFADMAAFGLLPNEWRPSSQGQNIMGETGLDKFAGGVGSVTGLVTGAVGATKASKAGWEAIKKAFARRKADNIATNVYKGTVTGPRALPPGPNVPQLGQGSPLPLTGRPGVPQLPGGGRYPMQTTPRVGDVGLQHAEQIRRLEEAIARMRGNPLPRYQEGDYVEPDMLDTVTVQAPRLNMGEVSDRQEQRHMRNMMQSPAGPRKESQSQDLDEVINEIMEKNAKRRMMEKMIDQRPERPPVDWSKGTLG